MGIEVVACRDRWWSVGIETVVSRHRGGGL